MKKQLLTLFLASLGWAATAQNVGIGTNTPNASAKLDVSSTNSGLLIPRVALTMTTAAGPITAPATSLVVYNTATAADVTPGFYYWDGTKWVRFADKSSWLLLGNTGINDPAVPVTYGTSVIGATENWMGTTDANDVVFGTNSVERMRIKQTNGFLGIGTANPLNRVDISAAARTGTHATGMPLYVTGTLAPGSVGSVGIEFRHNNGTQGIGFGYNTIYATGSNANQDLGFASRGTGNLLYSVNGAEQMRVMGTTGFVGIGTAAPTDRLTVSNGRVEFTNANDATGTAGSGVLEIANALRIDGNEIITNATTPLYLQNDNGGDLIVDLNTLVVDASANSVGIGTTTPNANAVLDITSTTKGMLTPRLTTVQRDAMGLTLTEGLLIYNTTNNCYEFWDTKAAPAGGNGFWNSLCQWCQNVVVITTNRTGFNLNTHLGGARAEHYCVYINAGVTLQASGNGGGSGTAGNPGFNASTMPSGASITLYNYGNIYAGGGNGGRGGQESDAVCQGDANGQNGGAGGSAILTNNQVPIAVFNYGTVRAGGGGGGGGGATCCSAGGGGGGGAGTPAGAGGGTQSTECTSGFVCGCGTSTSAAGNAGGPTTGGTGGGGVNRGATACTCNGSGAGTGGTGGVSAVGGNIGGGTQRRGNGGGAGLALQGNGSGSSFANFGTQTGGVNP